MALNHGQQRAMRKPIKRNAFYGVCGGTQFWITNETKELRENYRIRIEYGRNCKNMSTG